MDIITAINDTGAWSINREVRSVGSDETLGFFCILLAFEIT